ncbi:MAG: hypothetical protein WD030_06415 [Pirellulales bacterium]
MTDDSFNTAEPLAFFITWTCYGTWLPGDDRGWHAFGGGGTLPPNELFREVAASRMKETKFLLAAGDRDVVEATILRHCEVRGWQLHAVRAQSNHVHVVVTATGYAPETVREQFKAWCTRHLKRCHVGRERFWTEGGSGRSLNRESELEATVYYVLEAQDRKGRDEA